jgi:hypothetical protein
MKRVQKGKAADRPSPNVSDRADGLPPPLRGQHHVGLAAEQIGTTIGGFRIDLQGRDDIDAQRRHLEEVRHGVAARHPVLPGAVVRITHPRR